eukprot:7534026-Prorocentrum_lima.AAC.1
MAVFLFGWMGSSRAAIHTTSYRASINACENGGQWEMAMNPFSKMGSSMVEPNAISHSAVISA